MAMGETALLRIGDGREWHFTNAPWHDGEGDELLVPEEQRRQDGPSIQGHHHAVFLGPCHQDVRVRFEFRLTPHSDIGVLLRARSERCFYLLHFPDCGQASRAQHFWAAFSRMDDTGYLRRIRMELVRRVPSVPREWMTAEVRLDGCRVVARIGEHGRFEAEDRALSGPGRLGVYLTGGARIRRVAVEGEPVSGPPWDGSGRLPTNWIHPVPQDRGWQKPQDLLRLPSGEVVLSYTVQAGAGTTTDEEGHPFVVRSADQGRTWTRPEPLRVTQAPVKAWWPPRLHLTPAGRLIALVRGEAGHAIAESRDGARSWSSPDPVGLPLAVPMVEKLHLGPQAFLNLADGSLLAFLYGGFALGHLHGDWTWGSAHCQAFSVRSEDDGRTWSAPVNVDDQGRTREGQPIQGNLDLTEVCAAQMSNGRILALVRPIFSPWMWETWSADGSATWGPCVCGPFPGYATPNMLRTRSGAVLVAHRLPSLSINASWDEGRSWDQGVLIDSGLWCMGAMVEVEPDVVLYVYWDSYEGLMRAQRIRVAADRLEPAPPAVAPAIGA